MMERRRRVWRKEKLAESGKPDLKMPLSTIEKFKGGMRVTSSPVTTGAGWDERSTTDATSMVLHICSASSSSSSCCWILCLLGLSTFITYLNQKATKERKWDQENNALVGFYFWYLKTFLTVKRVYLFCLVNGGAGS